MKELTLRVGRFKGIKQEEADRLIKEAVALIRARVSFGAAASCNVDEVSEVVPPWVEGFQQPFPIACHWAMTALGAQIDRAGLGGEAVAYFFESGDQHAGIANRFMGRTLDCPELKAAYRHSSHTFIDKDKAWALQAADILAWEWAKFVDETMLQGKRPMRRSLATLVSTNAKADPRFRGHHLTGEKLKTFGDQLSRMALLEIAERIPIGPHPSRSSSSV
jgi:hypothetical protein